MPELIVVSGGQSGVDRAALDAAAARGVAYAGWCPQGGWAEDLPDAPGVLAKYPFLRQTPSADPAQRTEWNVRDSDACLVLLDDSGIATSRGTALAEKLAARYGKPLLTIDVTMPDAAARACVWLRDVMRAHERGAPFRLAIGGPRESEAPGIYAQARALIAALLNEIGA
ncbi:MAG TPA: putative molybdenum carrier protein [Pseudolabrys sp.]|nr:putative molybdenum carrier protein [Pseudolabrys sp.]